MLSRFLRNCFWFCFASACICTVNLKSEEFPIITEEMTVDEAIDVILEARQMLIDQGYDVPPLSDLCLSLELYFRENNIEVNEAEIKEIYELILEKENPFQEIKHKHKKHQKNKELKMRSKCLVGVLKCLAGGLLMIVPIPSVQFMATGLLTSGVIDIIDDAREMGDENARREENRRAEYIPAA